MSLAYAPQRLVPSVPKANTGKTATQCLEAIREGDPAAAQILYSKYADQIRSYLRRHTQIQEVEQTVFSILVEAVRSARESHAPTLKELSQTVKDLSQQGVFALRRKAAADDRKVLSRMTLDGRRDLVNGLFSVLEPREREILLRSSLLLENDREISQGLALPIHQISRTRAKARVLLRISSQSDHRYDPAAIA